MEGVLQGEGRNAPFADGGAGLEEILIEVPSLNRAGITAGVVRPFKVPQGKAYALPIRLKLDIPEC